LTAAANLRAADSPLRVAFAAGYGNHCPSNPHWVNRAQGSSLWLLECTTAGQAVIRTSTGCLNSTAGHLFCYEAAACQDYGMDPVQASWEHLWGFFHPEPAWLPLLAWPMPAPGLRSLTLPLGPPRDSVFAAMRTLVNVRLGPWRHAPELTRHALATIFFWGGSVNALTAAVASDQRVASAMALLCQQYQHNWTVGELATAVHLSSSRLAHLFRAQLGLSPMQYLERHRVERAKDLLRLTRQPINSVGTAVGYADADYFSRIFRRHCGQSPRQYRLKSE